MSNVPDNTNALFTDIPEDKFPFFIRAWQEDPFEIAWEIEIPGPGAITIPGAEEGQVIARLDILDENKEVVYRHEIAE